MQLNDLTAYGLVETGEGRSPRPCEHVDRRTGCPRPSVKNVLVRQFRPPASNGRPNDSSEPAKLPVQTIVKSNEMAHCGDWGCVARADPREASNALNCPPEIRNPCVVSNHRQWTVREIRPQCRHGFWVGSRLMPTEPGAADLLAVAVIVLPVASASATCLNPVKFCSAERSFPLHARSAPVAIQALN